MNQQMDPSMLMQMLGGGMGGGQMPPMQSPMEEQGEVDPSALLQLLSMLMPQGPGMSPAAMAPPAQLPPELLMAMQPPQQHMMPGGQMMAGPPM